MQNKLRTATIASTRSGQLIGPDGGVCRRCGGLADLIAGTCVDAETGSKSANKQLDQAHGRLKHDSKPNSGTWTQQKKSGCQQFAFGRTCEQGPDQKQAKRARLRMADVKIKVDGGTSMQIVPSE